MGHAEIVDHCQFREDRPCCSLLTLDFPNSLDITVNLFSSTGAQARSHAGSGRSQRHTSDQLLFLPR